jgi:peptide/nickel transport system permease protein
MIPTLFGVTVVSFVIMQLAPGDPLLSQLGAGGTAGQSSQTREAYLLQKRDLKLDKPIVFNFNYFRDFSGQIRAAAWFRAHSDQEIAAELAQLAKGPNNADEAARLQLLRSLDIDRFDQRLQNPKQHEGLAIAVAAFVRARLEDLGSPGVPAAIRLLQSKDASEREKIGLIRSLELMAPEPFLYTYSRDPATSETPLVTATWRVWWERNQSKFPSLDPDRKEVLSKLLKKLAAETSRSQVYSALENLDRDDTPFFAETLLGGSSLAEKTVSALFLMLYNGRPLKVDVPIDADAQQVSDASANWIAHFNARQNAYEPSLPRKLWYIVGDTQYAHMVWRLVTFDFGRSALKTREPVSQKIWDAFIISAPLMVMAQLLIYAAAIPLGILCAVCRGRFTDQAISLVLFLLYSIPAFVAGMLLLLFFCYGDYLKWFPMERLHSDGADSFPMSRYILDYLWHAALPVLCLSLFSVAGLAMYARTAMLDVIAQDYVRTARAKGVPEWKVILKHVLRNGLIPIITLFANFLPAMLGGSVLIEYLFNIPGMGQLSFSSIEQKDFPTLMALIYIDAIIVLVSILISDLLYVVVDPRISFSNQGIAK